MQHVKTIFKSFFMQTFQESTFERLSRLNNNVNSKFETFEEDDAKLYVDLCKKIKKLCYVV